MPRKTVLDLQKMKAGNQKINADRSKMEYGVSVTDKCIDWETTESLLLNMAEQLRGTLKARNG